MEHELVTELLERHHCYRDMFSKQLDLKYNTNFQSL